MYEIETSEMYSICLQQNYRALGTERHCRDGERCDVSYWFWQYEVQNYTRF
jgi:hypothetical protein